MRRIKFENSVVADVVQSREASSMSEKAMRSLTSACPMACSDECNLAYSGINIAFCQVKILLRVQDLRDPSTLVTIACGSFVCEILLHSLLPSESNANIMRM